MKDFVVCENTLGFR